MFIQDPVFFSNHYFEVLDRSRVQLNLKGSPFLYTHYLTIRLRAWDFYEVIVDEGEARINYHLIEIESE